ncbi:TERF2IP [Symbiodinium microadriaticum]|nr:TERF2IP [Symbiodinium microadriaticum]
MAPSQLQELKKEAKATPPSEIFLEVDKQITLVCGGCLVEKPTEHGINIIPEKSPPAGDRTAVSSTYILDNKKAPGIIGADGAPGREKGRSKAERKKCTAKDAALIRWVKSRAASSGQKIGADASEANICGGVLRDRSSYGRFQVLQAASATAYFLLAALQLPLQDLALSVLDGSMAAFRFSMLPAIGLVAAGLVLYGHGSSVSAGLERNTV